MLRRLLGRVRPLTHGTLSPEDLVQSAVLRLEERRSSSAISDPEAYLLSVARNISIDQGRRERVRRIVPTPIEQLASIADGKTLQDEVLEARERLIRVKAVLEALPQRTCTIFLMRRVDGLKYREIAEQLGITPSAVEKHVARAVLALSKVVDKD